jgi:hypothetical protein
LTMLSGQTEVDSINSAYTLNRHTVRWRALIR